MPRNKSILWTIACALAVAASLRSSDAAPSQEASRSNHTASFGVRVVGAGPPMILIPGLACSGDVWNGVIEHYRSRYRIHVLTLAGFAGQPAIGAPFLATVRADLVSYIEAEHLDHPIIVGHSLGGFLAFWVAATAPDRVGPIIAVDGVPFLPALGDPQASVASSRASAERWRKMLAQMSPAAYARASRAAVEQMVSAASDVDQVAAMGASSEPAAVGDAMYDLMTTDLRDAVARINTEVLLVASDPSMAGGPPRAQTLATYEAQVAQIPHHTVVVADGSRHFIMLDAPTFLFHEIDGLLTRAGSR
jgi:N-formylmaleamate deformylase